MHTDWAMPTMIMLALFKSMSSSPSDPMHQTLLSSCCLWLVTTTTYAHTFERGRFPYDAQEWENLEMRGWGRCLRKTKLHFVRKDKFIDICFGEYKRLSWDLYWVLCPEEFYYWLIKVVRKQSGENEKWQVQYLHNAISLIWLCFWRSVKLQQSGKLI